MNWESSIGFRIRTLGVLFFFQKRSLGVLYFLISGFRVYIKIEMSKEGECMYI